jgi:hypothetical protein|nr:MAG TPA: structural protein [Bacteriophage sp.]
MTISIKAFATHSALRANSKNDVYPIGEISAYAITYAKDRGIYAKKDDEDITLYTFTSVEDGNYIELSDTILDNIFTIVTDIYKKVLLGRASWADQVEQYLIKTYASVANSFTCGQVIKSDNYACPGWIEWKINNQDTTIRIWFSDKAFRATYDEYEISVVTPIKNVDDFFKSRQEVTKFVADENDPISMSERGLIVRDYKPDTIKLTLMFKWHDRLDPTFTLDTRWDVFIYGERGNNPDAIRDAIIRHILTNSIHDQDDWKQIFPDIFRRSEFIIIPRFDQFAIPNRQTVSGIYTPLAKYAEIVPTIKQFAQRTYGYTDSHIETYASVLAHPYRSLQSLVISHPDNRDNYHYLTDLYPDLIAEHSLSQDFNRMRATTRAFAEALMELIIAAESFTMYSTTPANAYRIVRDGKLYLSRSFNNINFLVAAKANFD